MSKPALGEAVEREQADVWAWFDELTAAIPEAERFRPQFQNLRDAATDVFLRLDQKRADAEEAAALADSLMKERFRQFLVEQTTTAFDKQSTYTTAILSVGYVGLFTTWNLTSASIPQASSRFVVVTALVSLLVFILFEVFKMVWGQLLALQTLRVIKAQGAAFDVENQKHLDRLNRSQPWFYGVWIVSVLVSLGFGLASASVLIYSHIEKLFFPALG